MRIFLDANILFSAAWRENSNLRALWEMPGIVLVTSPYALAEAERNILLKKPQAAERLALMAASVEVSSATALLDEDYGLPEKDQPILSAAAGSGCAILLTGDFQHFGSLFGQHVQGIHVLTPAMYFAL